MVVDGLLWDWTIGLTFSPRASKFYAGLSIGRSGQDSENMLNSKTLRMQFQAGLAEE